MKKIVTILLLTTLMNVVSVFAQDGTNETCDPVKKLSVTYVYCEEEQTCIICEAVITWEAPAEGDFMYKVYRDDEHLATVRDTSYTYDKQFDYTEHHTWMLIVVCEDGESEPRRCAFAQCSGCIPATDFSVEITDDCNSAKLTWSYPFDKLFNIYRNGELIKEKHDTTNYTDTNFEEGNNIWEVTAVCSYGASEPISKIQNCTGVNEMEMSAFTIYPNPTTGDLRITNYELRYPISDIVIYDVFGSIQKIGTRNLELGNSEININISDLRAGIYFVKITTKKGIVIKKIVKY